MSAPLLRLSCCGTVAGLLLLVLWLGGCDNTITPLADEADAFFAVHGFLDAGADTQFVRVEALRPFIMSTADTLDAAVKTTHLETGTEVTWRDSLVTLDDGAQGHLFFAVFAVEAPGTYRLDVMRRDGRGTRAVTRLPDPPHLSVAAPQGDTLQLSQAVTISGLPDPPLNFAMLYRVLSPASTEVDTFSIRYGNNSQPGPQGWQLDIFLKRDQRTILQFLKRPLSDTSVSLRGLGLEVQAPSVEWRDPTGAVNIEQGIGFFGAIGRYVLPWTLPPETVSTMGFVDGQ